MPQAQPPQATVGLNRDAAAFIPEISDRQTMNGQIAVVIDDRFAVISEEMAQGFRAINDASQAQAIPPVLQGASGYKDRARPLHAFGPIRAELALRERMCSLP